VPIQIKELQFDSHSWRLDWLGRFSYPPSLQSEPDILVYLSQLRSDYTNVLSNEALAEPLQHRVAKVKVGQLPLLKIGSVWTDGVPSPLRKQLQEVDLALNHTQIEFVRFDGHIRIDGLQQPVLPARGLRIGLNASREVAGSWLAVAYDPTPKLRFVAIPSTVLFQSCLASSPKAIRRLVYGQIDKVVDSGSGYYVAQPHTFYVNLFKDFRNAEAPVLANLIADPIGYREFNRFRNALVVATANFDKSRPDAQLDTHTKLGLPFSNPVQMKVRGKYLPINGARENKSAPEWGFLVTEIVDLKVRLAFDQLVIGRKNNSKQGGNAGDSDLPFAFRPSGDITPTSETEPQPITSAQDPAAHLETLSLEACGGFQPLGLNVVTECKDVQKYKAWPVAEVKHPDFEGVGTTGDPCGSGGLASVDLVPEPTPKSPVSLNLFMETLDLLARQTHPLETIITTPSIRQMGKCVVNFLPRKIKGVRSWHLVSKTPTVVPRGYIVAVLTRGGVFHYLIELERKGDEALALAHIRHHAGSQITPKQLHAFMVNVARANGWNAVEDYKDWVYQPMRHPPSKGAESFAKIIIQKLKI